MSEGAMRFDGKVAIVTGAGRGLGRSYAQAFAARGARVVVNDYGVDVEGRGSDQRPAAHVAEEIRKAGGEAVSCFASVSAQGGAEAIVDAAMDAFGRVDILVNNAGILREEEFPNFSDDIFEAHLATHVLGSWKVSHRVWPVMERQGGGRIVNIVSTAAFYGQAGNAAYSTCKAGVTGLTRSLALAGRAVGIKANGLAPGGLTRMAERYAGGMSAAEREEFSATLNHKDPTAMLLYLAHDRCASSGAFYSAMAGRVARHLAIESVGLCVQPGSLTPELIAGKAGVIDAMGEWLAPESVEDAARILEEMLSGRR